MQAPLNLDTPTAPTTETGLSHLIPFVESGKYNKEIEAWLGRQFAYALSLHKSKTNYKSTVESLARDYMLESLENNVFDDTCLYRAIVDAASSESVSSVENDSSDDSDSKE